MAAPASAPRRPRQTAATQSAPEPGDHQGEPGGLPGRDRVEREAREPGQERAPARRRRRGPPRLRASRAARRVAPQRLEPLGGEQRHGEGGDEQAAGRHPEAAVAGEDLVEQPVKLERRASPPARARGRAAPGPRRGSRPAGAPGRPRASASAGIPTYPVASQRLSPQRPSAVGVGQHVERQPPGVGPAPAGDEGVVHHHRARPHAGELQRGEDQHRGEDEADRARRPPPRRRRRAASGQRSTAMRSA